MPYLDIPCAECNTVMKIMVTNPYIINMFTATMIVIEHPTPVSCPVCQKKVVATVEHVGQLAMSARSPLDVQGSVNIDEEPSKVM